MKGRLKRQPVSSRDDDAASFSSIASLSLVRSPLLLLLLSLSFWDNIVELLCDGYSFYESTFLCSTLTPLLFSRLASFSFLSVLIGGNYGGGCCDSISESL